MIDFNKVGGGGTAPIIDPRKIFTTLARDAKFVRPSDVQADVLDQWFERRRSRNLTIKMNTGSGKTLAGLLILKSSLNEKASPAAYITPNRFLTIQVLEEAKALGITATDSEDDPAFLRGEAVLVANIFKLVNGGSAFGIGRKKIPLGAVVVDDAHACFSTIEDQFKIAADRGTETYEKIWAIFSDAMKEYDPFRHHDINTGDPSGLVEIPFWLWQAHSADVFAVLRAQTDDSIRFPLRLIEDSLALCQCVFTGRRLELGPRCTPIGIIPSFSDAARKVFMTATLANDGTLVTHLDSDVESAKTPIFPKTSDMGNRLILVPQEIDKNYTEAALRDLALKVARERNVVVLVPSHARAEFWKPVANQVLDTKNLYEGVSALRKGHVGLSVLINRYDGIDLPKEACELLILDGLPRATGPLRQRRSAVLDGSASFYIDQVQRVEQGMGRGVRSSDDRCVMILFGSDLTKVVNFPDTFDRFTPGTRAQIGLAREIAKQINTASSSELSRGNELLL